MTGNYLENEAQTNLKKYLSFLYLNELGPLAQKTI